MQLFKIFQVRGHAPFYHILHMANFCSKRLQLSTRSLALHAVIETVYRQIDSVQRSPKPGPQVWCQGENHEKMCKTWLWVKTEGSLLRIVSTLGLFFVKVFWVFTRVQGICTSKLLIHSKTDGFRFVRVWCCKWTESHQKQQILGGL